jgi:uncharacterized protein YjbJ (UPF0337 family)
LFAYSKATGNVKNTIGMLEEKVGDMTGLDSWKASGQQRQTEGNTEYKQAQAEGYVEGAKDRVVGTVDKLKGTVTGDSTQEAAGRFLGCCTKPP